MPVLIGIDVGTTSIRAIAFDAVGRRLAASVHPTPLRASPTGGEYDPDAVFRIVVEALSDLGRALNGRPVAGLSVASIGESCVLVDDAGRALAPSIAWFDRRTEQQGREITERAGAERVFDITGLGVDPIFTLAKLAWMRDHWLEAFAKARGILPIASWVTYRLCGEAATDPTLASRTLCFDIRQRRWSSELLGLAGVDPAVLPPILASGTTLGPMLADVRSATGLAGSPNVAVGGHDHLLGAFATGLTEPGTVVNSVGTAEALLLAVEAPLADAELVRRGYIQGAIETDRRMSYLGASLFSAGGAMDWLRTVVGDVPAAMLIEQAESVPAGSDGVVFLPHLANGPPPDPDPDARGAFLGLTPSVTPAVLFRAVMEGLAMQSRIMLDGMIALPGVAPPRDIRLIGGVSRNRLFLSIKASVLDRPLTVVEEPEATALGAALLGGISAGLYPSLDAAVAGLEHPTTTIEPDASAPRYEQLRTTVFEGLHHKMRPINQCLAAFRQAAGGVP